MDLNEYNFENDTKKNGIHDENFIINDNSLLPFDVNVSIEPNHECDIFEIKFDGEEITKEPPTYSENLAELISKIDFSQEIKETNESINNNINNNHINNSDKDSADSARNFFKDVHEKIKLSYDEVNALIDCLLIARADKMMSFEIGKENDLQIREERQPDVSDKTMSVILKRKNIEKARNYLKKSLDKISNDQDFLNKKFHFELHQARQKWRLKKLGSKFYIDLGYRSVGCVNAIKASVELLRNENTNQDLNATNKQNLVVIAPEELQDYAYIQVEIVKTNQKAPNSSAKNVLFNTKYSLFSTNYFKDMSNLSTGESENWQDVLEKTQNAIYCKEIYNQLLREIFDPANTSSIKPIIIGNSIQMMITMDHDLIISLVHSPTKEADKKNTSLPNNYNFDNAVLEYYLHSLLKKSFDQNFFHHDQRPITATFAYNSQIKVAGMAYVNLSIDEEDSLISFPNNISHMLVKKKKINLLQLIREKAEHLILRKSVLRLLKEVSISVKEPFIFIEPTIWNSSTSTDIIVTIFSNFYEALARSCFFISIKQSQIKVLNRYSNTSVSFTDNLDDFKSYLLDQCCFHQINLVSALSQSYGWTILTNSFTNEPNSKVLNGIALIYNNNYSKKIAIKIGPVNCIQVYVNEYLKNKDQEGPDMSKESIYNEKCESIIDWIYIKDNYLNVDIDSYPGSNQMQKFELILANYSSI